MMRHDVGLVCTAIPLHLRGNKPFLIGSGMNSILAVQHLKWEEKEHCKQEYLDCTKFSFQPKIYQNQQNGDSKSANNVIEINTSFTVNIYNKIILKFNQLYGFYFVQNIKI